MAVPHANAAFTAAAAGAGAAAGNAAVQPRVFLLRAR
jgi:hypothetical protein